MFSRKKIAVLVAEALGTAILTFSVLAVAKSAVGYPYFIAIGTGITLALLVATLGATSGAHANPAVTFGLWSVRKISTLTALTYIAAQFVGALATFQLYQYVTSRPLSAVANGLTSEGAINWRIAVAEMVGTAVFTFGVAAAVYQKFEGGKKAAVIGGSLGLGILIASVASKAALNPAVALGTQTWDRVYIAAPLVGALVGMNLYALLFAGEKLALLQALPKKASKKTVTKKVTRSSTKKKTKK